MKIGIFSDIHANWEALAVVLKALKRNKVETTVCLGDIVGYGADPKKCTDKVRKLTPHVLAGNHDHAVLGLTSTENFNQHAKASTAWTAEKLNDKRKAYLNDLPLTHKQDGALFVHSTPEAPEKWNYIISNEHAHYAFKTFTEKICFIGHSHYPIIFKQTVDTVEALSAGTIEIAPDARYIVNVGSVGQPRDRNTETSFCIYDTSENTISIIRLPYNIEKAQVKIVKRGLPEYNADRLALGR